MSPGLSAASSSANAVLERWYRRFRRSLAIYQDDFADEKFHDLVAVLVTGALIEALLYIGIQLAGYKVKRRKKTLPMKQLIGKAVGFRLLENNVAELLHRFADIRNSFAHDIDYRFHRTSIKALEKRLPAKNRRTVNQTLENMPGYKTGTKARIIFMEIVELTNQNLNRRLRMARSES